MTQFFKSSVNRSGKRQETSNESLSINETLSKYGLSLPLHTPTTGPAVCYGAGRPRTAPGECSAGLSTPVPKLSALHGALYISIVT